MTEPDGVGFSDREMVLLTTMAHLARATLHKNLSEATLIATKLIDHYAPYEVDDVVLKLNIPCNTAIDRIEAQREKEKGLTQ